MEFLSALSIIATISTICLFLTGGQLCMRIRRQGNTKNVSMFPFISMVISSTFWFKYGVMRMDPVVMVTNGVGMVLAFIYCLIYYVHSISKETVHKLLLTMCLIIFPFLSYIKFAAPDHDTALNHLGLVCGGATIVLYGSPLISVAQVVKSKSTEALSFPMCLANFVVSAEWFIYGRLTSDIVMQVPNFIGSLLGLVQVLLFAIYPTTPRKYNMSGGNII